MAAEKTSYKNRVDLDLSLAMIGMFLNGLCHMMQTLKA